MFCPKCRTENPNTAKFCRGCGQPLPDFAQVMARTQAYHQAQAGLNGQTLDGKYRIDAKLGAGGMGNVYRATRLLIGDVVAIKTLHPHLVNDQQASERFRREAITATKLRHKNIITIYDVGIDGVRRIPYILMELAEGYTLRQIINENKILPLDFCVTVVAQVCAALSEAHQRGIIHRDIKPENIIANQTSTGWHVKVLDFGIAKLYDQNDPDLTQDGSALGTPQYMSPEQCLGEKLDASSDIYSIGVTLYEMLCGKPPFYGIPATAISVHQVSTPPPTPTTINAEIHAEVEKVILKALSKDKESRQQTAHQLAQEFIQAATIAFKEGAKQEAIEEPSVEPISKEFNVEEAEAEEVAEAVAVAEITESLVEDETVEEVSETVESSENLDENLTEKSNEEEAEEDLTEVFEEAEHLLDDILDDSKKNDTMSETENENKSVEPIPMPDKEF